MDAFTMATFAAMIASRDVACRDLAFGRLVYKPELKAVVEVGSPLSEVSLATSPPESDFNFEPPLMFDGRVRVSGSREIELPSVEWDY